MKVIEYFTSENKEHWKEQIALADWSAAKFLLKLLNNTQKFDELLGGDGKLFFLLDGENIVSFVTLTRQDCIRDENMFPWLGFLYTYPAYRGNRYSEKLLKYAEEQAISDNHPIVYLATDHIGLYEKYGYTYLETRKDYLDEDTRIYYKKL
ncbi:GNAT family N-acetyltransferase [Sedimentibacter hydroxybenzoicus DSM 7310]|uniref:GNAT family N-acetyltransferase n=1 Tax=Sedimentibacter hydroxybenzoicus DSM 7310 TaxID=1123245 RepID=A0A974BJI5_SEDHY|nr:GNAT family N-acetyltransferase [Sedimentibacter hydroxybenzoicus]NYB74344.1 GNAT family N-acetyltransferase [Sedimentibacter hydroxybenzoicus DSM 7310]